MTLHHADSKETVWPSFVTPVLPYPGLRILHANSEWEVKQVRLHVRDKDSLAARNDDPHLMDVLASEVEGMFA